MQLDFFSTPEFQSLNSNVEKYKTSADAVRRGVFARVGELAKKFDKQQNEIEELKNMVNQLIDQKKDTIFDLHEAAM